MRRDTTLLLHSIFLTMNKFALGAVAGSTSLLVAVPFLAQMAGAASGTTTKNILKDAPVLTQVCVQALADQEATMLNSMDARNASQKALMQTHQKALAAAAAITDDTARSEAVKKAQEDMRTAMKAAMDANKPDETQMEKMKTACGDSFGGKFMFGPGPMGMEVHGPRGKGGPGHGMLEKKLGMTAEELKTALSSGKTIEQIATEKGVTLPAKGERFMKHFDMDKETDDDAQ